MSDEPRKLPVVGIANGGGQDERGQPANSEGHLLTSPDCLQCGQTRALEEANLHLLREIAERMRAERKLQKALRLEGMGRLAAGLCHEINNPLNFIIGSLDGIREILYDPMFKVPESLREDLEEMVRIAIFGADRITSIVRSVKLFARQSEEAAEFVELGPMLRLCTDMLKRAIESHIEVTLDSEAVPAALGRRMELQQVFTNLLENAAYALSAVRERKAHICVTLREGEPGRVTVSIADTGPGIAGEALDKIFDPFFTTKPIDQGSGLGLSICHSLILGMNGTIEVETREGVGTVFTVDLPAVPHKLERRASSASDKTPHHPRDSGTINGIRVLALDDEPFILRMLRRVLRAYDVTTVTNGYDALALCMTQSFDIILSDIMMPGVSGKDFFYMLAMARPGEEGKIVFVTGGTLIDEVRFFLDSVPNPCLEKPINAEQVLQIIHERTTSTHT